MRALKIVSAGAALAVSLSCGAFAGDGKVLTKKDNASSVKLAAGENFVLELPGNPTTGFVWSVVSVDTAAFKVSEAEVIQSEKAVKQHIMGAPSLFRWRIEALKESSGSIKLAYARSWEHVAPAEEFSVNLVVAPKPSHKKKK